MEHNLNTEIFFPLDIVLYYCSLSLRVILLIVLTDLYDLRKCILFKQFDKRLDCTSSNALQSFIKTILCYCWTTLLTLVFFKYTTQQLIDMARMRTVPKKRVGNARHYRSLFAPQGRRVSWFSFQLMIIRFIYKYN